MLLLGARHRLPPRRRRHQLLGARPLGAWGAWRTRSPPAPPLLVVGARHRLPPRRRRHQFFASSPLRAWLSSIVSARSCLRRRFSSSSARSRLASETAIPPAPALSHQPLEGLVVARRVGQELLEAAVLLLERPQPLGVRDRHPAVLGPPLVEGRGRDAVSAAELRQLRSGLVLPDDPDDLLVGETARAHLSSSRTKVEQILLFRGPV